MVLGTEGMEGGKKGEGSPAGRGAPRSPCAAATMAGTVGGHSPVGIAIRSDAKQHVQATEARVKEGNQNAL